MKDLDVVNSINNTSVWLLHNQWLIVKYIENIIEAMILVIAGIITSKIFSKILNRTMIAHQIDPTIADFLSVLFRYGIIIFTLIISLDCIGVQTTSIITILGAAGITVGLALRDSLSNLAAGMLLVTFRPFRIGEYIDLGEIAGNVINVQILSITLRTLDGKIVVIPNGKIIYSNIINFSREPVRRNEWMIGVSYDSDIDFVKKLLMKILSSEERILKDKDIIIRLNELGSSSIIFIIRAWSKNNDLMNVYWDILERIKCEFDSNGIIFPYQKIDINFKKINNFKD